MWWGWAGIFRPALLGSNLIMLISPRGQPSWCVAAFLFHLQEGGGGRQSFQVRRCPAPINAHFFDWRSSSPSPPRGSPMWSLVSKIISPVWSHLSCSRGGRPIGNGKLCQGWLKGEKRDHLAYQMIDDCGDNQEGQFLPSNVIQFLSFWIGHWWALWEKMKSH